MCKFIGWSHKDDYYKVLGIPRNASKKEVKKAYYEVSRLGVDGCNG